MKYLLLIVLLLTGCSNCNSEPWNKLKFGDKVRIINEFYYGQTGIIKSQAWLYSNMHDCNLASYIVELNFEGRPEINISQSQLEKINE